MNNAGVGASGTVLTTDEATWDRLMSVNVKGTYLMSRAALAVMVPRKRGVIVNAGSIAGIRAVADRAAYVTTKFAVVGLTKAMALDHVKDGIRVNAVCPGTTMTPWIDERLKEAPDPKAALAALVARQPMGRLGTAEEMAAAYLFLASDESAFTTGLDAGRGRRLHLLMEALVVSTSIVALAEMGDETQLLSFVLAAKLKRRVPIVLGILVATLANHFLAGGIGAWLATLVSPAVLRWTIAVVLRRLRPLGPQGRRARGRPEAARRGSLRHDARRLLPRGDGRQDPARHRRPRRPYRLARRGGRRGRRLGMMIANVPAVLDGQRCSPTA